MSKKRFKWHNRQGAIKAGVAAIIADWSNGLPLNMHTWFTGNYAKFGSWEIGNVIPNDLTQIEKKFWSDVDKTLHEEYDISY